MLSVGLSNDQMDVRENLNPAVSKRFALQCSFEVLSRKNSKKGNYHTVSQLRSIINVCFLGGGLQCVYTGSGPEPSDEPFLC